MRQALLDCDFKHLSSCHIAYEIDFLHIYSYDKRPLCYCTSIVQKAGMGCVKSREQRDQKKDDCGFIESVFRLVDNRDTRDKRMINGFTPYDCDILINNKFLDFNDH